MLTRVIFLAAKTKNTLEKCNLEKEKPHTKDFWNPQSVMFLDFLDLDFQGFFFGFGSFWFILLRIHYFNLDILLGYIKEH